MDNDLPMQTYEEFIAEESRLMSELGTEPRLRSPEEWYREWEALSIRRVQTIQAVHRKLREGDATSEEAALAERLTGDRRYQRDRIEAPDERD